MCCNYFSLLRVKKRERRDYLLHFLTNFNNIYNIYQNNYIEICNFLHYRFFYFDDLLEI